MFPRHAVLLWRIVGSDRWGFFVFMFVSILTEEQTIYSDARSAHKQWINQCKITISEKVSWFLLVAFHHDDVD